MLVSRRRSRSLTCVAVILHERLGNWARQLRPRLQEPTIRWFETRSQADLDDVLTGLSFPIVLVDLGKQPAAGLNELARITQCTSDALVLVLDPESHDGVAPLARELGAAHVESGSVPAPFVAGLLSKWVAVRSATSRATAGPQPRPRPPRQRRGAGWLPTWAIPGTSARPPDRPVRMRPPHRTLSTAPVPAKSPTLSDESRNSPHCYSHRATSRRVFSDVRKDQLDAHRT